MEINESEISCGIQQLVNVGEAPTMADYQEALKEGHGNNSHDGLGCFLIASVPWNWKNSIKFLESVGFKSHGVQKNPNSKRKIVLFSKNLTAKERRSITGSRCRDCDEPITGRNRICDMCKEEAAENKRYRGGW